VIALSEVFPFGTWWFTAKVSAIEAVGGVRTHLQWSTAPSGTNSWQDLPDGAQFGGELYTTNVPSGTIFFRAAATAPGYLDGYSEVRGPYSITQPLVVETQVFSGDSTAPLAGVVNGQSGFDLWLQVTNCSNWTFYVPAGETVAQLELTFMGLDSCSEATLSIHPGATLVAPAGLVLANNALLANSGTANGNVTLASSGIVSQGAGNLSSHAGGSLAQNAQTPGIVSQGAGNIVSQGAGNIVSQGAGNIVSQPVTSALSALVRGEKGHGRHGPIRPEGGPIQPAFTGQMSVNGDYSQFAGTLFIGIAGAATASDGAQQFDQLVVSGQAYLMGGGIAFGLFDPNNQTNTAAVFQPPLGATFDVVVASNIVVSHEFTLRGPIWGDGQFFSGSVITRPDGLQAVRLVVTNVPPLLFLQTVGAERQLTYATNYAGYTIQSTPTLSPPHWTGFSTNRNPISLNLTNASRFFRLSKP